MHRDMVTTSVDRMMRHATKCPSCPASSRQAAPGRRVKMDAVRNDGPRHQVAGTRYRAAGIVILEHTYGESRSCSCSCRCFSTMITIAKRAELPRYSMAGTAEQGPQDGGWAKVRQAASTEWCTICILKRSWQPRRVTFSFSTCHSLCQNYLDCIPTE